MSTTPRLSVSGAPHISAPMGTRGLMMDVLVALVPALCVAVYFFGFRVLTLTAVSVAGCVFFEWGYRRLLHKPASVGDLSAVVTGVLMAFVCPVTLPYWTLLLGDFFAIVVVKQLFGGLGMNFLNPALAGRAFLFSYASLMSNWVLPLHWVGLGSTADAVTGPTPLAAMSGVTQILADGTERVVYALPDGVALADLFVGNVGGSMGETSVLMLLIGGVYLIARGVIRITVPASFLGTVALLTFLFPRGDIPAVEWMLFQLMSGGLVLGALFMATDYATSPVTPRGELIYGAGCGVLVVFIRYFGAYPEGVCYAILVMNCCTWLIDLSTRPRRYGIQPPRRAKVSGDKGKEGDR